MKFGLEKESSSVKSQYVELEVFTEEPQDSTGSNADVGTGTSEDIGTDPKVEEPTVQRSGRVRRRPEYYLERVSLAKDGL